MTNKEIVEAKKELGIVPEAKEVFGRRIVTFVDKYTELKDINDTIKALEERKKEVTKALVEMFADNENKTVMDRGTRITLSFGRHTSINKERLLANGVTADIIIASTKETTYEYVTITPAKDRV